MKIKHSKFKNTGILFELLVRQITADTLKGIDSPAIDILRENFVKTQLGREYKLYESILKSKVVNESRAHAMIATLFENSRKFSRTTLKKQKYNLINEIKKHYNLEEFFGSKVKNYKEIAAIYTLIESYHSEKINLDQVNDNKVTILEFLTKKEQLKKQEPIMEEYSSYDKDLRTLTYRVLLEKFNDKYDNLSKEQKDILKEFIYAVDSKPALREFYNEKVACQASINNALVTQELFGEVEKKVTASVLFRQMGWVAHPVVVKVGGKTRRFWTYKTMTGSQIRKTL